MGNLIQWLFTDPVTACTNATASNNVCVSTKLADGTTGYVEVFHFWWAWIAVTVIILGLCAYYGLEGRKRLVKGRTIPLHKYMLDKFVNQVALWAIVAPFLMFGRYALDSSLFAWRFWRYAWLAWAAGIGIYWLVYFVRHYQSDRDNHYYRQMMEQYKPGARTKRKSAAGAR